MAVDIVLALAGLGLALAAAGWLANRLRVSPAIGYLAVGLALSPHVAATPTPSLEALDQVSHVAVLFLLFFIGLELDLKKLRDVLSTTFGATVLNIAVPAFIVTGLLRLLDWDLRAAAALGLAMGISSTIFGERLSANPTFGQEPRRRMLGILLGEDVGAAALLAIIVVLGGGNPIPGLEPAWLGPIAAVGILVGGLILLTAFALLVVPRLLDSVAALHVHEILVLSAVGLVLGFGAAGQWAGSAELGSFVVGVACAEAGSRFVVRNSLLPVREISLALFLMASGMHVDASTLVDNAPVASLLAAAFLASKLFANVPTSLAAGLDFPGSLRTALGLGTLGEFSLILVVAAEAQGIAHPQARALLMGTTLILLVAAPLLLHAVPWMAQRLERLPQTLRRPLETLVRMARPVRARTRTDPKERWKVMRILASNLVLLVAWTLLVAWLGPRLIPEIPTQQEFAAPIIVYGMAFAIAAPLLYNAYRSYRDAVWAMVGLRPGERDVAVRVRSRLVDAWVAATVVLFLAAVSLVFPAALPVLLGGLFLAVIIATLAWRQLSRFHETLEASVTRVLGQDAGRGAFLDHILETYPWGVRFAAVAIPPASPVAGQTVRDSRIGDLTGATVAMLQRRHREIVNPGPNEVMLSGDTVVLMGDLHQLARAEAIIVSHGEALRLSVQSRMANLSEIEMGEGSDLDGLTLGEADVRGRTGALVVGVWPKGMAHPVPFRPDVALHSGDRLIVLGAPLQINRARRLATTPTAEPREPAPAGWGEGG